MTFELERGRRGTLDLAAGSVSVEVLAVAEDTIGVRFVGMPYPREGAGGELRLGEGDGAVTYHVQVVVGASDDSDTLILQRVAGAPHHRYRRSWRVPMP